MEAGSRAARDPAMRQRKRSRGRPVLIVGAAESAP
jgi:hypothetical protein